MILINIFLSTAEQRKVKIISLLKSKKRYFTIAEIARKIEASAITIEKDLFEIKAELKKKKLEQLVNIDYSKNKRIKLIHSERLSLDNITKYYSIHSFTFKILQDIFMKKYTNMREYAETNFISLTIAYKKITKIEPIIKKFGVNFNLGSTDGVAGEEIQIRHLYASVFCVVYGGSEWKYQFERKTFENIISLIEEMQGTKMTIASQEYYYQWLGIIFTRVKEKKYLSKLDVDIQYLSQKNPDLAQVYRELFDKECNYGLADEVFEQELAFLYLISYSFAQRDSEFNSKNNLKEFFIESLCGNSINNAIKTVIGAFVKRVGIVISEAEYNSLREVMQSYFLDLTFFKGNSNYLLIKEDVRKCEVERYLLSVNDAIITDLLEKKMFGLLVLDINGSASYYTDLLMSVFHQGIEGMKIKVYLAQGTTTLATGGLKKILMGVWFNQIEFVETLNDSVDFIISDREYIELKKYSDKMLVVSEKPKESEINKIKEILDNLLVEMMRMNVINLL